MNYAKAEEVLPARLVDQIRKHCTGMIYVKSDRRFYKERYREVVRLHGQGLPTKDIGTTMSVSCFNQKRTADLPGKGTAIMPGSPPQRKRVTRPAPELVARPNAASPPPASGPIRRRPRRCAPGRRATTRAV